MPKGGLEIRPAMDRMRESVFAVLGDLTGLSFLDLFSGSGIIALEASSRGASPVACVEKDPGKFMLLLRNVSIAENRIECRSMPVERFLLRNKASFSVVFLDPPFSLSLSERASRQPCRRTFGRSRRTRSRPFPGGGPSARRDRRSDARRRARVRQIPREVL